MRLRSCRWMSALVLLLAIGRMEAAEPATPLITNLWFPVGEELRYTAHWGVFHVADSQTTATWTNHEGRELLAIVIRTTSTRFLSVMYPVDDRIETLVDPATFLPVRFTKTLNEGRYHTDEVTTFDHAAGMAYWHNRKKDVRKEFAIEPDTRDVVSLMYYLRQMSFEPGQTNRFRVMADEKMYDLLVRVAGLEKTDLDLYGEVPSLKVEPDAAFEGLFVRKGKVTLWVSQDPRRILTRVVGEIPVANIRIKLAEVRGPGDDMWIIKKEGKP